jgi:hypothetical protein
MERKQPQVKFTQESLKEMIALGYKVDMTNPSAPKASKAEIMAFLRYKQDLEDSKEEEEEPQQQPPQFPNSANLGDLLSNVLNQNGNIIKDALGKYMGPEMADLDLSKFGGFMTEYVSTGNINMESMEELTKQLKPETMEKLAENMSTGKVWEETETNPGDANLNDPATASKEVMKRLAKRFPDLLEKSLSVYEAHLERTEKMSGDPESIKKYEEELKERREKRANEPTIAHGLFNQNMVIQINFIKDCIPLSNDDFAEMTDPLTGEMAWLPSKSKCKSDPAKKKMCELWWSTHNSLGTFLNMAEKKPHQPMKLYDEFVLSKYGPILRECTPENIIKFEANLKNVGFLSTFLDLEQVWQFIKDDEEKIKQLWVNWKNISDSITNKHVFAPNFQDVMIKAASMAKADKPPNIDELIDTISGDIFKDPDAFTDMIEMFKTDPKILKTMIGGGGEKEKTPEIEAVD